MSAGRASRRRALAGAIAAAALAALLSNDALAATAYPTRPIRFVLALSPGGTMDTMMRLLAEKLELALGVPVVIDNKPGASGNIASDTVARAPADGHTFLVAFTALAVLPNTYGARAVDPLTALAPVTKLVTQPVLIVATPSMGVDSLSGLIAAARAAPGKIAYATGGVATIDHLSAAVLSKRGGIDMVHVPYNSVGQEIKDLLGGEVRVSFILLGTAEPYLKAGQFVPLAFTGPQRVAAWPNVPTVAESGFPGFDMRSWFGVLAPAGTPKEIIERMNQELVRALNLPEVRANLASKALDTVGNSPEQFGEELKALVKFWGPVVTEAGIPKE
jgi:tripartite-type tricarboxylate transporter receptor subunit TctC